VARLNLPASVVTAEAFITALKSLKSLRRSPPDEMSTGRPESAQMARVWKIWAPPLDVLKDENRWKAYVGKVKRDNLRRPAFQEEFAKIIPGWRELV
jgi:hypothetical protein